MCCLCRRLFQNGRCWPETSWPLIDTRRLNETRVMTVELRLACLIAQFNRPNIRRHSLLCCQRSNYSELTVVNTLYSWEETRVDT